MGSYTGILTLTSITIASGGTTSDSISIAERDIVGLIIPTLTSTDLEVQVSNDDSTWYDLYDATGTQTLKWSSTAGNFAVAARDLADLVAYPYIRVNASVAQAGERTFTILAKEARY